MKYKAHFITESCVEHYEDGEREDGIYVIDPDGLGYFEVKCLMSPGNGGWTVIQRRQDGSVDFFRNWAEYENGFGNFATEFWLGLKKIHRLTKSGHKTLKIDMTEWKTNEKYHATYSSFSVSGTDEKYQLKVSGYAGINYKTSLLGLLFRTGGSYPIKHSSLARILNSSSEVSVFVLGNAENDAMEYHNDHGFATKDEDYKNCASTKGGGWWYRNCAATNPNGPYMKNTNGLYWEIQSSKSLYIYPETFQMAIRPSPNSN